MSLNLKRWPHLTGLAVALAAVLAPSGAAAEPPSVTVLVVYYTQSGNTQKMAMAVAQGAQALRGTTVLTKKVNEVSLDDLEAADSSTIGISSTK